MTMLHPDPRRAPAEWLLPPAAYTSPEWFEREMALVVEPCWAFAGMADDVPDPGDYTCTTVGRAPLVVVRGDDGELRAFHNLCRHRGVELLTGRGNVARGISCFYHRWRYDLEGSLRHVPQAEQFDGLCREELGLRPASVATWNGLLFVHVDPEPPHPLLEWLGDVPAAMGPFEPLGLMEIPVVRHEIRANWKFFLENHVDGYHLWHLHARSIRGLAHQKQDWAPTGRHWTFYEPPIEEGAHADQAMTGLPLLPTQGPGGFGSSVHLVFPTLAIAGGSTFWTTIQVIPTAPDATTIEMRTRIAPLDPAAKAAAGATLAIRRARSRLAASPLGPLLARVDRGATIGADPDFVAEDIRAAEAMQRAIRSPQFSVGPMARDHENAITFFQRNILELLGAPEAGA